VSENNNIISDLLTKVLQNSEATSKEVSKLSTKIALLTERTENELRYIKSELHKNTVVLDEHHNRSVQLKRDNELRELKLRAEILGEGVKNPEERKHTVVGRLERIELASSWLNTTKNVILYVGAIAAAILAIFNLNSRL
jgi:hypothetical protein